MKFKLEAGMELDLLTAPEVSKVLADWMVEISRGVKFRQFSAKTDVAGGVWTIGGNQSDNRTAPTGPAPGMVWAVTRVAVSGGGFVAGTDTFSVFIDEITPSKLVISGLTRGSLFDTPDLILNGGEKLTLNGVGTGVAGTDVTVSGQAVELPVQLAWQLL